MIELEVQTAIVILILKKEKMELEERWLMHYSSLHQIFVVGDGDFSFSLCLANSFGSASNILASSHDSYGFCGKEDSDRVIKMHRELIRGFFRNASRMLRAFGEIHVSHKTTGPFCRWNLDELAKESSLVLIDCVDFNKADYPGYNQKRGDGARCDEPFPLGECRTFKFIFPPSAYKIPKSLNRNGLAQRHSRVSVTTPQLSTKFDAPFRFNAHTAMNGSSHCAGLPQTSERFQIFGQYFNHHARETFGKVEYFNHARNLMAPCYHA